MMINTLHALTGAAAALCLLSACAEDSSDSRGASSQSDAGPSALRDGGSAAEPNRLADAGHSPDPSDAAMSVDAMSGRPAQPVGGRTARAGASGAAGAAGSSAGADSTRDTGVPDDDAGPGGLCASCGGCEETIKVVSTMHTENPVTYSDPPPTSGPHNPCWGRWGVHDEPLRAERWVHNLEHGGVVFLYNCPDGCAAEVSALENIVSKRYRTILTAYADLPTRFGVVSWGHRLTSDCFDENAYLEFYNQNFDHAPESNANPPNPSCPP